MPGHRGDRLRRGDRGDPRDRLRRLADGRALPVRRRPRRRGPAAPSRSCSPLVDAGRAVGLSATGHGDQALPATGPAARTSSPPRPTAWPAGSWSRARSPSPGAGCRWSLASMAIYAARDRAQRRVRLRDRPGASGPGRPLALGPGLAAVRGLARRGRCWSLGPGLAALERVAGEPGRRAGCWSACVLAYDAGLKRTVARPRGDGGLPGPEPPARDEPGARLGGPVGLARGRRRSALFVAGVTWISRSETESGRTAGVVAGMALQNLAVLGLLAAALQPRRFPSPGPTAADRRRWRGCSCSCWSPWSSTSPPPGRSASRSRRLVQRAVKTGVLSLVWLNVGVVAAVRGPGPLAGGRRALGPRLRPGPLALLDLKSAGPLPPAPAQVCWSDRPVARATPAAASGASIYAESSTFRPALALMLSGSVASRRGRPRGQDGNEAGVGPDRADQGGGAEAVAGHGDPRAT